MSIRLSIRPFALSQPLVVLDFEGSKLQTMAELPATLLDISIPVDILVTKPTDFAWRKDVVRTIEWPAFKEGKVLYARP